MRNHEPAHAAFQVRMTERYIRAEGVALPALTQRQAVVEAARTAAVDRPAADMPVADTAPEAAGRAADIAAADQAVVRTEAAADMAAGDTGRAAAGMAPADKAAVDTVAEAGGKSVAPQAADPRVGRPRPPP